MKAVLVTTFFVLFLSACVQSGGAGVDNDEVIPKDIDIGGLVKTHPFTVWTMVPLRSVTDTAINLTGEWREETNTEAGDYATDFAVSNNHIAIYVDAIGTGGDIVITGTSISETTAIPTAADTETITIDTTDDVYYQSEKKWWEVTNIDITTGTIVGIDYDVHIVGYTDMNNFDSYKILGYRLDCFAQGVNPDIAFRIIKVKDDSTTYSKRMELVDLEWIGVDANGGTNQIEDRVRTGGDDRSLNPAVGAIWADDTTLVLKQYDFDTYFTSDENVFNGQLDEGLILRLEGEPPGAISNVDWCSVQIRFAGTD